MINIYVSDHTLFIFYIKRIKPIFIESLHRFLFFVIIHVKAHEA